MVEQATIYAVKQKAASTGWSPGLSLFAAGRLPSRLSFSTGNKNPRWPKIIIININKYYTNDSAERERDELVIRRVTYKKTAQKTIDKVKENAGCSVRLANNPGLNGHPCRAE